MGMAMALGIALRMARRRIVTLALAALALAALTLVAGCRNRGNGSEGEAADGAPGTASVPAAADAVTPTENQIVLYFPGAGDEMLHGEKRTVLPLGSPEDRAKQCLEELIHGPQPPLLAALPDGVRVRQVYLLPDGTAFADLSGDMLAHRGGSLGELQTVYAVVDTLAANVREIRRVGILVDGKTRETLAGHVGIAEPLAADYQYVDPGARPAPAPAGAREEPGGGAGGSGTSGASGGQGGAAAAGTAASAGASGAEASRDGSSSANDAPADGRP